MFPPPGPERRLASWSVLALPLGFGLAIGAALAGVATATLLWIALGCAMVGAGAVIVVMVDVERDRARALTAGNPPMLHARASGGLPRATARPSTARRARSG